MGELKITTLSEDISHRRGLFAEHGLSLFIEYKGYKVLFDTGQGPSVIANARAMNIDLRQIDVIVLSHGHYDHTGGLYSVLRKVGSKEIYAHPDALQMKYKLMPENSFRASGIPTSQQELIQAGAVYKLSRKPTELIPGLIITGEIPRITDYETNNPLFYTERDNDYVPDSMLDDQALVLSTTKGPVIITGCAHAGLINTLKYATTLASSDHIYAVMGGTHLFEANSKKLERTIEDMHQFKLQKIVANHCTGINAQAAFQQTFRDKFILNTCGDIIQI
jgi:7,8-dihydropterin-6-yl-methyl-4-(beta-D-ribofuranosyl)aminobenzene 5'-phosphate synthase